jgi:hypothetical protein
VRRGLPHDMLLYMYYSSICRECNMLD